MRGSAVLLINLGSPDAPTESALRRYLGEFLMDPHVIDVPYALRALLVKGFILRTRPTKSAREYARIWTDDGSPLILISERMRSALESRLRIPVGLAMRYGEPAIPQATDALLARCGASPELLVAPLYPQYAMATTLSAERAVSSVLQTRGIPFHSIGPFFDDSGYLAAMEAMLRRHLPGNVQYVLFSYHGVPNRHLRKVDPTRGHCLNSPSCCADDSGAHATCYRRQCMETTRVLAERLSLLAGTWGYAFQSNMSTGWTQPVTEDVLASLPERGITRLAVVCPSFTADCLETLEEIAVDGKEIFLEAGGTEFTYVPCLNDDPLWIEALASLCGARAVTA